MMWEIMVVGILMVIMLVANGKIDGNKFVKDNSRIFQLLREDDFNFLVMAKYGDQADADVLFNKRVKDGLFTLVFVFFIMLMMTKTLSFLNLVICFAIGYVVFKSGYTNLKTTIKNTYMKLIYYFLTI